MTKTKIALRTLSSKRTYCLWYRGGLYRYIPRLFPYLTRTVSFLPPSSCIITSLYLSKWSVCIYSEDVLPYKQRFWVLYLLGITWTYCDYRCRVLTQCWHSVFCIYNSRLHHYKHHTHFLLWAHYSNCYRMYGPCSCPTRTPGPSIRILYPAARVSGARVFSARQHARRVYFSPAQLSSQHALHALSSAEMPCCNVVSRYEVRPVYGLRRPTRCRMAVVRWPWRSRYTPVWHARVRIRHVMVCTSHPRVRIHAIRGSVHTMRGSSPYGRPTLQKVICNFDIRFVISDASQQQKTLLISYTLSTWIAYIP